MSDAAPKPHRTALRYRRFVPEIFDTVVEHDGTDDGREQAIAKANKLAKGKAGAWSREKPEKLLGPILEVETDDSLISAEQSDLPDVVVRSRGAGYWLLEFHREPQKRS